MRSVGSKICLGFLAIGLTAAMPAFAADKDKDKDKTKEQQEEDLRNEAKTAIGDIGRQPLHGKFTMAKDDDGSIAAKPFPKAVGTFESDKGSYTVMVATEAMLKQLMAEEKKSITVFAKVIDKQDQGNFAIVDEIAQPPAPANQGHRKRGSPL